MLLAVVWVGLPFSWVVVALSTPEKGNPLLTIVVPTRNRLSLLRECVTSIQQGLQAARLIVVDDASDDGTERWLQTVSDPHLQTLSLAHRVGGPEARNQGLRRVETQFVLFLDDDDLLVPSGVGALTDLLVRHPAAVAAIGRGVEFDENGDRQDRLGPVRAGIGSVFPEILAGWCPQVGQAVFSADAVRAVGGWSSHLEFCNDYDLWLRVAAHGPVVLDPVVTVEVRVHDGQISWSPDRKICTAKELSRSAARRSGAPLKTTRVHVAAWNRYQAQRLEEHGHRIAAAAAYLSAMVLAPELRRSAVMGPELRGGLRRVLRDITTTLVGRRLVGRRLLGSETRSAGP